MDLKIDDSKRISLKELRDSLNKISDEDLDNMFVSHSYATEFPEDDELTLICMDEDFMDVFEKYDTKIINSFIKGVWNDSKKIFTVIENSDLAQDYAEDFD